MTRTFASLAWMKMTLTILLMRNAQLPSKTFETSSLCCPDRNPSRKLRPEPVIVFSTDPIRMSAIEAALDIAHECDSRGHKDIRAVAFELMGHRRGGYA